MPYTDDEVAEEVAEEMPASLREGTEDDDTVIEGEDVSEAQGMGANEDWMEPAKSVTFEITKCFLDTYTPEGGEWKNRSLKLYVAISKDGTDGKGKYARKVFFPGNNGRILVAVNRESYDFTVNAKGNKTEWYKAGSGGAFGEYNELLMALKFPNKPAPRNDKAFRDSLVGMKFVADITKEKREVYDRAEGKSVKIDGEYENHLRNWKPVKSASPDNKAEEAAA